MSEHRSLRRPFANKAEQSRIAFDQQADTYDSDFHGRHAGELYPFVLELMMQLPVRDVLGLGCGTCALMKQLYSEGYGHRFTGIDLGGDTLHIGAQVVKEWAILLSGNAASLSSTDVSFDLIYCSDSLRHYPDPCRVLQGVVRVLRYGGYFVIGDYTQGTVSRILMNLFFHSQKEGDVHMYSEKEICMLLQERLHDIHVQGANKCSLIA